MTSHLCYATARDVDWHMPHETEFDVVCRLLEAGLNVVTTRWEFNHHDTLPADIRRKLDAACERGKSSLYATGSTPGFGTELLPMALTSIMRRIDCITQTECADISSRNSPEMLFDPSASVAILLSQDKRPRSIRPPDSRLR